MVPHRHHELPLHKCRSNVQFRKQQQQQRQSRATESEPTALHRITHIRPSPQIRPFTTRALQHTYIYAPSILSCPRSHLGFRRRFALEPTLPFLRCFTQTEFDLDVVSTHHPTKPEHVRTISNLRLLSNAVRQFLRRHGHRHAGDGYELTGCRYDALGLGVLAARHAVFWGRICRGWGVMRASASLTHT
jgi:hypothetical protein